MKRILAVALALFFCLSCTAAGELIASAARSPEGPRTQEVFASGSAEQVLESYFEKQYSGYAGLSYVDISGLLNLEHDANRNMTVWLRALIQRRRLLQENGLCYVDTQKHAYTISYVAEKDIDDERMQHWQRSSSLGADEKYLHFRIKGEAGKVYPPFMAVNALHTVRFTRIDGAWKITMHYYPGVARKFKRTGTLSMPSEESMLADLRREFAAVEDPGPLAMPENAWPYSAAQAVSYANTYTESRNSSFYKIGDWMGNCQNFTSQCVWYGLGSGTMPNVGNKEYMTGTWYAGQGGGSPAWENVVHFWNYVNGANSTLVCQYPAGVSALREGDIIQTRNGDFGGDDSSYNHSLVVVDADKLILGQNSPGCFVYYSDLLNVKTRFVRPAYLVG